MENKHNTQKEPKMCECNILPPGILKRMILEGDEEQRNSALYNLQKSASFENSQTIDRWTSQNDNFLECQHCKETNSLYHEQFTQ